MRVNNQFSKRFSTDAKISYITQNINNKIKVGEESGIVQNLYKIPRSVSLETAKEFEDKDGNPKSWATSSIYMNPYWTLNRVLNGIDNPITSDFFALDIKQALHYLGEIVGTVTTDDLLDNIFSKF